MTTAETRKLLTVPETCDLLRVSRATLYRLVSAGEVPARKVGHGLRFDRDELFAYVDAEPEDER